MTVIPLAKRFLPFVRSGAKTSTIRQGVRSWTVGPAIINSHGEEIKVCITEVRFASVASLTDADALKDGFKSLCELLQALREFYPNLSPSDKITIASFRTS